MSNYTTTQDLIADVLFRAYEAVDGSSQYAAAVLKYLNRAYRSLWIGGAEFLPDNPQNWWWLRAAGTVTLQPVYETGTISVTQNSVIATLSATPSISLQGYYLLPDDFSGVYQVASHVALDVGVVLDSVFVGSTNTALSFKLAPLEYALPDDCLKTIDPLTTSRDGGGRIYAADLSEMLEQYPPISMGLTTPKLYAPIDESTIRFNSYIDTYARIDVPYLIQPDDLADTADSVPLVPINYRHVLADMAVFFIFLDKEDAKAESIGAMAKALIKAMATENRKRWDDTSQAGQIKPRQGQRQNWRRTASGLRLWQG